MNIFDEIILRESYLLEDNADDDTIPDRDEGFKHGGERDITSAEKNAMQRSDANARNDSTSPSDDNDSRNNNYGQNVKRGFNLAQLAAKIAQLASKNPKMLIVLVSGIVSIASYYSGYQKGKQEAPNITQKLIIAAIGGALSVGLLAMGYKLIRHVCSKSAAEVASSNKPKEQKLKTLNGLLNAAQKAVSKAKTTDDKTLAQASVDIIQRHINTVQNQA